MSKNKVTKTTYSDITRKCDDTTPTSPNTESCNSEIINTASFPDPTPPCASSVFSASTKRCDYNTWEYAYFEHLINIRDRLVKKLVEIYPEMEYYLYTPSFMHTLCKFLYATSSGKVCANLNKLSEDLEDIYAKFKGYTSSLSTSSLENDYSSISDIEENLN